MTSRITTGMFIIVLLASMTLLSRSLFNRYQAVVDRAEQAEEQIRVQSAVIAQQDVRLETLSRLSAEVSRANRLATVKSEEKVIEYRTILKTRESCEFAVPAAIADGLLSYAYRLRAEAVSNTAGNTDPTSTSSSATSQLTYCQAVLWIEPLLTAIAQANDQLEAIRRLE